MFLAFCRSTARSTATEVGRPGGLPTCTKHAQVGSIDRTVDRQRAFALWKWPGRLGGRPLGHCPVGGRPVGRPVCPTVENLTVGGQPDGRPSAVRTAELASNGQIFWSLQKRLHLGCFRQDFWRVSKPVFPIYCRGFLHLF